MGCLRRGVKRKLARLSEDWASKAAKTVALVMKHDSVKAGGRDFFERRNIHANSSVTCSKTCRSFHGICSTSIA